MSRHAAAHLSHSYTLTTHANATLYPDPPKYLDGKANDSQGDVGAAADKVKFA